MYDPNPQKPFAYLPKPAKKAVLPINHRFAALPSNYTGICTYCVTPYQKCPTICKYCKAERAKKKKQEELPFSSLTGLIATCKNCGVCISCFKCNARSIVKFPPKLLPWYMLPPALPAKYGWATDYLVSAIPFHCYICEKRYSNLAIFTALCNCKEHSPRLGRYVCRFCCSKTDPKLLKAMDIARQAPKQALPVKIKKRHRFFDGDRLDPIAFLNYTPTQFRAEDFTENLGRGIYTANDNTEDEEEV